MAKQLNVSLAFTADTREAKAQLQDLQRQLNNILKTPSNKLGITNEIREAISATAELSSRLQQAINVNTGNLDFSKFNNSLKQSGQSLSSYGQQLQKLGPTGQQAFLTLTKSIATAEIPIKRTNALVKEFTTTLANTARWQVSSSVLHGLMGSMQSAYHYAQDLNESLNDIRIVTGQSVDQMAKFAAEANAAAKALSATTVEYTNASLIYYQQGLSDQQVKDRTDITIKMANVSKQSAEVVSEQMTAVWNNFYNGSKSLEYYADVMTALGAATASSADEIAGGLEKFAAIGDTIGLSYEYAAAALATITSNTRQSEEVVGTALKTIFARIQGLNLGETLDDGTTLNKYSSALEKVGISIFDSAGELKRMDNILDEMGTKWETLNKAQQTALAQTVAGTRQYTQLVALMDNWNKGDSDSMKANLSTAYGSSGALQEQADIYAESWEAARDRVTAAAEKIYGALLNDDFFIDMLNGFEKILTFVSQLIDNLGGLQGVLLALGAIVTKVFSSQISQGLTNMAYNIKMMTKSGRESVEKERRDFIDNAVNSIPQSNEYTTDVEKAQQDSLRTELTLQMEYMNNAERMSSIEAETNKKLIERTKLLREQTVELQKQKEQVDKRVSDGVMDLRTDISAFNMENRQTGRALSYNDDIQPEINNIKSAAAVQAELKNLSAVIELVAKKSDKGKAALAGIRKALQELDTSADQDIARLVQEINQLGDSPDPEQLRQKLEALNLELEETIKISKQNIKDVVSPEAGKKVDALTQDLREQAQVIRDVRVANQEAKQSQEDTSASIAGATGAQKQWSDVMVESANVAFNVASAISMVSSAIDTLKDPNVSGMQKLVTVLSTMGMVLPTIISLIGTMKKLFSSETVAKIANAAATWAQVAAEKKLNEEKGTGKKKTHKNIKDTWNDTKKKWNEIALEKDKSFTKLENGNYQRVGDPKNTIWPKDAAASEAGKSAAKALGSKVASVGIAAAGIAIIIGTVAMVVNQLNKAEKAVERAKAAAQSLSENYDNVKASYDNFINAQSGYETAVASMEELTKGTVAYQEALIQANEAAGELLATNKNLKYTIEDGKIVIDEDSLKQAKVNELKKVESAQAAKIAGQHELSEAQMQLKKRDAARDMKSGSDGWQKAGNATAGGILGAVGAGLAAGGIAGAIGGAGVFSVPAAIIGGIAGLVTGIVQETSTETEQEAFDALAKQAEKDETFLARLKAGEVSADELNSIGIEDEALITSLQQNGEQVSELVGEMAANTAAINAQNDLVASNVLSDNEAVQKSEYKDQIIDIAGDAYGHAYDKAMESEWVNTWGKDGIAQIDGANDEAKKVFDEYLKYAGLEDAGYTLTDTWGNDNNREFVYKDSEGEEHVVSLEAMQAARAAYEASNTLDQNATKLAVTFDKLAGSSNEADQALLSFVSNKNFEDATKGELEDIQEEVGSIEKNADGTFTQDSLNNVKSYLENALGETLTDDIAISYGYKSADAMLNAFATKLSDADEAWDSIKVPDNFKFAEDMSLGAALSLEKQINKINLGPLGKQAGEEYVTQLNSMLSQVDVEDQQKALNALTAVDWSDWDALEQVDAIMKEFGVDIDTSSEEWQNFAEKMRIAAGATPDFSQLRDTLISITAILQDLDFGSVISEEDYQKLVQYNDEWERFFMLQANGTRIFIGNSDDMQQTLREDLLQKQKDLQARKEAQEGFEEANWGHYDETGENWVKADWNNISGSDTGTAANLIKSSGATEDMLEQLGYTDDIIQGFIDQATSGQEDLIAEGQTSLREMYKRIAEFSKEDLDALDEEYKEMIASTATNVDELKDLLNDDLIDEKQYSKQLKVLASQATKFKELSNLKEAGLDAKTYGNALVKLGSQYSDCVDEVNAYNKALKSGNVKDAEKALKDLEKALKKAEFEKFAKDTLDFLESLKDDTGWANNIENINKLREAYQYLLDTDFSGFSEEFLKSADNINLMTEALKGSDEAWDQLKINVASEIFNFAGISGQLRTELDAVTAMIAGYDFGDIEIGTDLNDTPFWDALSQMEIGSVEAAQAITDGLSSMGVDAELEKHEVTIPPGVSYETRNGYHEYVDNDGNLHQIPINSQVTETDQGQTYTWYTIKGAKYNGKGVTPPEPPEKNRNPGGGGGSQPKKATPTKKSDVVKRYKEIEDKLDDIRDEADRTRSSLDRLYGAEHEAAIQRLLELEQQEIDLLKEKEQEARNYLQEDLKELKKVSAEVDVEFKFDDNNNIENYEEEMTELYEELAEIQRKAGDEWDENEQKEIDALNEKIQKLEEAIAAYEETRELLEDINAELDAFKGKPALPLITSDTLDIYWEINDALDDIDEQIKDLERRAEGLSGEEKLKVLEEINRLEQERVAILQQQAAINQTDIEEKRAALDELARLNGLQFEYDDNNNIINYQEQMGILQAQLDELYAKRTEDGSLSPADEEAVNSIIAKMKELEGLAVDFRNAVEESEDIFNEIEDILSGIVADPFVRSDFVDIFKETNDQLDDIDRKISKLQNEADKLTGEARRKKLNEIVTLERKRVEILEHQALIAKIEMEDRKRAMEEIAARQELMFEYDENQNITNYQDQLDILIDKYEKAYNEALGDDGLIDATEQAILDAISNDIDHLKEFIQAYCDAVDKLEDIEDEREEIANGGYVDMSQLDDIADELHDINQSLDDLQELLDDSSRAADRLYGAARIKQMEKNADLLQQEIDLLQQKKTAQDDIIAKEKQQLDEKTGGYIKYDEYGRITNYDSYINAREDQIREYEATLQEGGLTETEATLLQDEIDLLNEQIAAMEDYEQALEEKEDIQNQIEDAYYEWQDLNAEKLQYKLELQLDVNDRELAKIERAIKRLDGNFYSRAEALALMVGGGMNGDSKLGNYNKQLADLEAHYQEVKRQYEAGEISQAAYVEMTKELQAEIESTADAMAALQDQMDSYYKDTLAQARQELNFHISQLTHLTGILNHFKNTLTALGKSKDYEMMGTVLEGQVQALENEVKASKNAMQMWQKEADSIYQKYQQALSSGNQENADMYYNAYKEALSAANEAENKFYQQSAAWANALRALMENTLAGLAQDLENALTGGTSFDTITTQMKRASSLQEEYLTTTNKIYETTKLMRTAQQEIDKTTNSVAKQKLSQFITETKQMQNQNKLSKYELSIQQAKYDLLVAEIALEEARFAKSTVRLRRDSEGNFGYVYTADAQAIATAEQKFEDAQNKLYNIGLDGANKYTEKYQQTLAEMYNTLTSLQTKYLQGGFESEAEYNAAVLEAKEYYYEKLNQYSELYSVAINAESSALTDTLVNNSGTVTDALTKNSRIAAEAWSTDFADMTTKTDQWMVAVTDYLSQVQTAFADWEVESQRIANETVGTDLTTLKNKVNDIVTESDNLTVAIGDQNSGVIKAIYDEITAVSGLVAEYANLNGQLTDAIQNAQDLSDALQQDIDQAGQDENPPGQYAPGEEESQKPGTVVPEGTDPMDPIDTPEDPPHEHYYVKSKTSPTCTEKGYTTYTCSCGDTYDGDFVSALGHDFTEQVIAEATETSNTKMRKTCQRCGYYEDYEISGSKLDPPEGSPVDPPKNPPKDPSNDLPEDPPNNPPKTGYSDITKRGVALAIWNGGYGWGHDPDRTNRLKERKFDAKEIQNLVNKTDPNGNWEKRYPGVGSDLSKYSYKNVEKLYGKFDTGGYTGAWGPEGKWAMLHEKEIVLNKEDTKNFLASLELLDNILNTIDLHAMNSQWSPYLTSPGISNIGKEALEQMVNIEASFPNATDKHEIEEAFKDLVNLASQYANRK